MIVVTGATGKLGHHVIDSLSKKVDSSQIAVAVRNPEKASDFAARGIQVRHGDYNKPETLSSAFKGADKILLISSSEVGQRTPQHKAVIETAKNAGVQLLAYTSVLRADSSPLGLAKEHLETENAIRASGLPYVFLRNGWYLENHTESLGLAIQHGVILGSASSGRFSSAARADYAEAAVEALTTPGQENKIYELAGDKSFTLEELAAEVSRQAGKSVVYKNLPPEAYGEALAGFGLPKPLVDLLVDSDLGAANGALYDDSNDLSRLIRRPTTSLALAVTQALVPKN